jgi:hypothetical protein
MEDNALGRCYWFEAGLSYNDLKFDISNLTLKFFDILGKRSHKRLSIEISQNI